MKLLRIALIVTAIGVFVYYIDTIMIGIQMIIGCLVVMMFASRTK